MDSNDSGIFRLASVGSHLDALSSITREMSLSERSNLIFLDKCLHEQWGLGQNVILNWCPRDGGVDILVVPHYAIAAYTSDRRAEARDGARGTRNDARSAGSAESGTRRAHTLKDDIGRRDRSTSNGDGGAVGAAANNGASEANPAAGGTASESFFKSLLSGRRRLEPHQLDKVARLLGIEITHLPLRHSVADNAAQQRLIEKMIRRYSIGFVPNRGVALFDIVGFGLLSPFEQMTQLNSLAYSLNSAQSKLSSKKIGIDFARSTTGDGFYVWNRELTLDANINLYHFMHLALADNAIARSKAQANTVPELRACFHIGGSYEFHQAEGLNPSVSEYIVGDVTIELARMIERTLPNQILVGDFKAEMPFLEGTSPGWVTLDSIDFVARARRSVAQLRGLELSGDRIDLIRCYLTGAKLDNGEFTVRRITVDDKHGFTRVVYNSKANIYRKNADPILLGIEDRALHGLDFAVRHLSRHVLPSVHAETA